MITIPARAANLGNQKRPKRKWLIVGEDAKSSLLYFKGFPIDHSYLQIETSGGVGDPQSVVEESIRLRIKAVNVGSPYAQVWAVFDRDDWPLEKYHKAFELANRHDIYAIFSNQAFELWYVLHFAYRDTGMHRDEYEQWLNRDLKLGRPYSKSDPDIYSLLAERQKAALVHADRLYKLHCEAAKETTSYFVERQNPCTNVQILVRELNGFLRLE